jgi:malate dehydrogenase (oxaloacetate-decarboxylating)
MQATGVVALATVLAGVAASGTIVHDHRVVILGAGTAGVGIADQLYKAMLRCGLSEAEARARFWLLDRKGLLLKNTPLLPFQESYARRSEEVEKWSLRDPKFIDLYDVIKNVQPTILIGCSTASGAFTEEIVKLMAAQVARPIIMPLSNPNFLSEAKPEDLMKWTNAKAIIATGSPFQEVNYEGKWYRIAQSNNALAFPGIGLGAIAVKAKRVTDGMLWAATQALCACSPARQDKMAPILPKLSETKMISSSVALAVAQQACKEGVAQIPSGVDLKEVIRKMWLEPQYYPFLKNKVPIKAGVD